MDQNYFFQPDDPQGFNQFDNFNQGHQRQVSFGEAISRALTTNYCNFSGRASRSEFWWFQLFGAILGGAMSFINAMTLDSYGQPNMTVYIIMCLINLALFLPNLGISVRRLHDIYRSGWWVLLGLLCCVGTIILNVWYYKESDPTENEYGPVPNMEYN
ncbi:MAG: DUF805 domain-containing protein [Muribaculaceae bacterium]|nr:DUF805 domain-containing protein [Muribaculaceae bacterium]